jgi:hypothetical protein
MHLHNDFLIFTSFLGFVVVAVAVGCSHEESLDDNDYYRMFGHDSFRLGGLQKQPLFSGY